MAKSQKCHKKWNNSKSIDFSTIENVLECVTYPIETIKSRLGHILDFMSFRTLDNFKVQKWHWNRKKLKLKTFSRVSLAITYTSIPNFIQIVPKLWLLGQWQEWLLTEWQNEYNFFIVESHSQMSKTCAKLFLGWSEEKVHGTYFDIICPSGLWTYKNLMVKFWLYSSWAFSNFMTDSYVKLNYKNLLLMSIFWERLSFGDRGIWSYIELMGYRRKM